MPLSTVSPDLASSPSRSTAVLLGIAALGAAVGSLGCYGAILGASDWDPVRMISTQQIAVFYLPLAGLVGLGWVSTNLRVAATLGALAGAWLGLAMGLIFLIAVGEAGTPSPTVFWTALIIGAALGAGAGSTVITTITWALRAFTRWLGADVAPPALRLWLGSMILYVLCIPPVLWVLSVGLATPYPWVLLLGGGFFARALWSGVDRPWCWLAAAPLVALALLVGWYLAVDSDTLMLGQLPLVIGLHTGPLAALIWGWLAWAGYASARTPQ